MNYRYIDKTGLRISLVSLGTMDLVLSDEVLKAYDDVNKNILYLMG